MEYNNFKSLPDITKLEPTISWLITSDHIAVQYLAIRDILDYPEDSEILMGLRKELSSDPWIVGLLDGQIENGSFGGSAYQKWRGAHWRLVSLVELGIDGKSNRALKAYETVIQWLRGNAHRKGIVTINGLTRRCASQEGNALAVGCRLGLAGDERVKALAADLIEWQWPDGGWNCRKNLDAHHSSFYETITPLWGLIEYFNITSDPEVEKGIRKAINFFLRHKLYQSDHMGKVIDQNWLKLHYPLFWHYDILHGMLILSRFAPLTAREVIPALDILESKRLDDGTWKPSGYYWNPPGKRGAPVDVVDWGRRDSNLMITLNALRVLKSAGRYNPYL